MEFYTQNLQYIALTEDRLEGVDGSYLMLHFLWTFGALINQILELYKFDQYQFSTSNTLVPREF